MSEFDDRHHDGRPKQFAQLGVPTLETSGNRAGRRRSRSTDDAAAARPRLGGLRCWARRRAPTVRDGDSSRATRQWCGSGRRTACGTPPSAEDGAGSERSSRRPRPTARIGRGFPRWSARPAGNVRCLRRSTASFSAARGLRRRGVLLRTACGTPDQAAVFGAIGHATSTDGVTWTKLPAPRPPHSPVAVLDTASAGSGDSFSAADRRHQRRLDWSFGTPATTRPASGSPMRPPSTASLAEGRHRPGPESPNVTANYSERRLRAGCTRSANDILDGLQRPQDRQRRRVSDEDPVLRLSQWHQLERRRAPRSTRPATSQLRLFEP